MPTSPAAVRYAAAALAAARIASNAGAIIFKATRLAVGHRNVAICTARVLVVDIGIWQQCTGRWAIFVQESRWPEDAEH